MVNRLRSLSVSVTVVLGVSCGGGSSPTPTTPTPPAPPPPPPAPQAWALTGRLTDASSGQAIPGATLAFQGRPSVTTDGDGRWQIEGTGTPAARFPAILTAPGFVVRETSVGWQSGGRQDIALDLLPEQRGEFVLPYYRELVRNVHDSPATVEPLRRWTTNPNFYVNTFNPKTGRALEADEIALVVHALRESVPQMTGGRFVAGAIETGEVPRDPVRDWINVSFIYDQAGEFCGQAVVGTNPGWILINYDRCYSTCGSLKVQPETVAHEVGHAMGFWHANDGGNGILNPARSRRCLNVQFSARERLHARVAYSRPVGNLDPDRDPATFAAALAGGALPVVTCRDVQR